MRSDLPLLPKQMQKLPIDERGFPVPWFVQWINGKPEFRVVDQRRFVKAINERRCWVCGNPLYSEEVFTIGPMCAVNRISSEPPSHRECAQFSAMGCPFLSKPQMVRRTNDLPPKKDAAGIMIERNPGVTLLWFTRHHRLIEMPKRPGVGEGVLFQIGRPFKVEWYCKGRFATRAEVIEGIESGLPILREQAETHDGAEGMALVEKQIVAAWKFIPKE
jgi:hypothetical protein